MGRETEEVISSHEDHNPMKPEEATKFRGAVALLNYYAQDCPGAQFASKEASNEMAEPREGSWGKVKRAVRFLIRRRAVVWKFGWQAE